MVWGLFGNGSAKLADHLATKASLWAFPWWSCPGDDADLRLAVRAYCMAQTVADDQIEARLTPQPPC